MRRCLCLAAVLAAPAALALDIGAGGTAGGGMALILTTSWEYPSAVVSLDAFVSLSPKPWLEIRPGLLGFAATNGYSFSLAGTTGAQLLFWPWRHWGMGFGAFAGVLRYFGFSYAPASLTSFLAVVPISPVRVRLGEKLAHQLGLDLGLAFHLPGNYWGFPFGRLTYTYAFQF